MSQQPQTVEEVFDLIRERILQNDICYLDVLEVLDYIKKQIEQAKRQFPFMRDKTEWDYVEYRDYLSAISYQPSPPQPVPTSQQFWRAAYEYDPLGPNPPSGGSELVKLIASGCAGPFTLGRLDGITTLKLIPAMGALPGLSIPGFNPPFGFAATDSVAISYPGGHPSEEMISMQYQASSSSKGKATSTIKPQDDDKLRRCAALGWVMRESLVGDWEKTGHVLVIDMDDRAVRHRQPWFVLASEWPTDGYETPEGGFTIYAEEEVERDDTLVPGRFLGDDNRTTICRIKPMQGERDDKIVLQQFGEDFDFVPVHVAENHQAEDSDKGPGLARIMQWHWDPEAEEEVCYTKDGLEYMRYNRQSKEYTYPNYSGSALAEK
ncbi:MAG: hypothetical protein Q9225_003411 [Loekoesia sp. 1 TL-2023]